LRSRNAAKAARNQDMGWGRSDAEMGENKMKIEPQPEFRTIDRDGEPFVIFKHSGEITEARVIDAIPADYLEGATLKMRSATAEEQALFTEHADEETLAVAMHVDDPDGAVWTIHKEWA